MENPEWYIISNYCTVKNMPSRIRTCSRTEYRCGILAKKGLGQFQYSITAKDSANEEFNPEGESSLKRVGTRLFGEY